MTFQRILLAYILAVVLIQASFAAFPGIDLAVSGLFANEDRGFGWVRGIAPEVNLVVRRIGEAVAFLLIAGIVFGWLTG